MKKYMMTSILCILLLCSGCMQKTEMLPKEANPFFAQTQMPEEKIEEEIQNISEPVKVTPPVSIVTIKGREKLNNIADIYPEFYSYLNRIFNNYEQGKILDMVNIFLTTKIKDEFLFSETIDKKIIESTNIEILSAIVSDHKLIMDIEISYLPVLVNALSQNENLDSEYKNYSKYSNIEQQTEYFTLTFDILKFSSSEGVKIKDYKYKDYIIRALTNTLYDSKKYILEYSEDNNQELFDKLVKDLRENNYENQTWMTEEIIRNLTENQDFLQAMLGSFTIKSINKEYYIITYPDIKNCVQCSSLEMQDIMTLVKNQEINLISKIVHDPDLNKLYNLIKNLMIV